MFSTELMFSLLIERPRQGGDRMRFGMGVPKVRQESSQGNARAHGSGRTHFRQSDSSGNGDDLHGKRELEGGAGAKHAQMEAGR